MITHCLHIVQCLKFKSLIMVSVSTLLTKCSALAAGGSKCESGKYT